MDKAPAPIKDIQLLTESSWEVCNKIGGIYTVLSTKSVELKKKFGDAVVFIGPDFGQNAETDSPVLFKPRKTVLNSFSSKKLPWGLKARCGRWNIPGSPLVVLVDFKPVFEHLNGLYGEMWQNFGVDSLHAYGDYDESCAFAVASAIVTIELGRHLKIAPKNTVAHYNEWTVGMGLLYTKLHEPGIATVFTTHATTIGRSICGNGKPLYQYFENYNGDQMAAELNVASKHSLEKAAAWNADCFTTVSDVTARECRQLLGREPDVVTPNGFEPSFVPDSEKWLKLRKKGRERILHIASLLSDCKYPEDTCIIATSGRNEFRNKGLDIFIDAIKCLGKKSKSSKAKYLALVLVPAWVKQPSGDLLVDLDFGGWIKPDPDYLTHRLHNEESDAVACGIRRIKNEMALEGCDGNTGIVYVPSYLDGCDGVVNISYYDFLPAIDLTVFASYYEPWGYTPLESIAFGIPTLTTDKAGFGEWACNEGLTSLEENGVKVLKRDDSNYAENVEAVADAIIRYNKLNEKMKCKASRGAVKTSQKALWNFFIQKYFKAFDIALENAKNRNK